MQEKLAKSFAQGRDWLSKRLSLQACTDENSQRKKSQRLKILMAGLIFMLALGVRFLHWQDSHFEIVSSKSSLSGVYDRYKKEATRMLEEGGLLFPTAPPKEGDARMLVHPPGYAILLAAIYKISNDPLTLLWIVQAFCDALAAVMIFLIAAEFFPRRLAFIAGLLIALSPHLAYYSLILSPDSLPVLPILFAVYFLIRALRQPRLIYLLAVGLALGLSCWFRANGLLIAPVLAVVVFCWFERGQRLRYSTALLAATIFIIAPITIRNFVVFKRFIPISIAAGLNLAEGIGNYDPEGTLGMPRSDREARFKDAEWHNRPDYVGSLWYPDGIERDEYRTKRAVEVIRARPLWFAGVMVRRAGSMLRYNDSLSQSWIADTARVPIVLSTPPFNQELPFVSPVAETENHPPISLEHQVPTALVLNGRTMYETFDLSRLQPTDSLSTAKLISEGETLSAQASTSMIADTEIVQIEGDHSEYGDQFVSAPINLKENMDYLILLSVNLKQGPMAIKVTSADRRYALASVSLDHALADFENNKTNGSLAEIQIPFASGNKSLARLVVSNNGASTSRPVTQLGQLYIYELGATPYQWTKLPRPIIRSLQKNLFTTARMLPLIFIGILMLAITKRWRALMVLLAVPIYYLCVHSVLSTEYRYILGIHYFLQILAAVSLYSLAIAMGQIFGIFRKKVQQGFQR